MNRICSCTYIDGMYHLDGSMSKLMDPGGPEFTTDAPSRTIVACAHMRG